jgi:hypothetical protein
MIKFSNRILTAEEGAEQDAEFAKEHFDFREGSPESEPAQPETTNALTPADRPKLSVEMATEDDATITKKSCDEYVSAFRSGLLKSARGVLEMCRAAYEAKQSLNYPEFEKFCEEIRYRSGSSAIRKFLVVGKVYPRLIEHADKLPASWTSMYLITQIPNEDFERLIGDEDARLADLTGAELNDMVRKTRNNESVASVLPIDKRTTDYVFGKLMFTNKPDDTDWRATRKALAEVEARLPLRFAVNAEAQRIWEIQKTRRYEHGKTKYQAIEFKPEKWDLGLDANAALPETSTKKNEDAA